MLFWPGLWNTIQWGLGPSYWICPSLPVMCPLVFQCLISCSLLFSSPTTPAPSIRVALSPVHQVSGALAFNWLPHPQVPILTYSPGHRFWLAGILSWNIILSLVPEENLSPSRCSINVGGNNDQFTNWEKKNFRWPSISLIWAPSFLLTLDSPDFCLHIFILNTALLFYYMSFWRVILW